VPALETMAPKAVSLGLELNWQKTKVQALGSREEVPSTITVLGQEVAVVEEFVHSSTQNSPDNLTSQCCHVHPLFVIHAPASCGRVLEGDGL